MQTVLDLPAPHVLRTEDEFRTAVAEIDRLVDENAPEGTGSFDRLELLALLVEDYERRHYPIDDSNLTPQDYLDFLGDQRAGGHPRDPSATSAGG